MPTILKKFITAQLLVLGILFLTAPLTLAQATATTQQETEECKIITEAKTNNLNSLNQKSEFNSTPMKIFIASFSFNKNKTFTKPINILGYEEFTHGISDQALWESATNEEKTYYCKAINYLTEYIELAQNDQINDCSAKQVTPEQLKKLQDGRCTSLKVPSKENTYYNNAQEAQSDILGNQDGKINEGREKCNLQLPAKITECSACLTKINKYKSGQLTSAPTECQKFATTSNCQTAYICSGDSSEPTLRTDRTPFGTEFFDVTNTQTGLNTSEQKNTNFTTNIQGGPIIGTINTVANFLVRMISVLALLVFIAGSFILITANGEENQLNRGKDAIKLSLVGIVIVMLSYTIVVLVQSIFF